MSRRHGRSTRSADRQATSGRHAAMDRPPRSKQPAASVSARRAASRNSTPNRSTPSRASTHQQSTRQPTRPLHSASRPPTRQQRNATSHDQPRDNPTRLGPRSGPSDRVQNGPTRRSPSTNQRRESTVIPEPQTRAKTTKPRTRAASYVHSGDVDHKSSRSRVSDPRVSTHQ